MSQVKKLAAAYHERHKDALVLTQAGETTVTIAFSRCERVITHHNRILLKKTLRNWAQAVAMFDHFCRTWDPGFRFDDTTGQMYTTYDKQSNIVISVITALGTSALDDAFFELHQLCDALSVVQINRDADLSKLMPYCGTHRAYMKYSLEAGSLYFRDL
eukprot:Skav231704  [mRNA]  locus=scaffold1306:70321:70797:- [translate_table: standard]